jgi:hypothetical protein
MAGSVAAVLVLLLLSAAPVRAAVLKDIRIGEHPDFTRIVLELDGKDEASPFLLEEEQHLILVFNDTFPELVRRIPVERTQEIEDLQILSEKGELRVSFRFAQALSTLQWSMIDNPLRLIIDFSFRLLSPLPSTAPQWTLPELVLRPEPEPAIQVTPLEGRYDDRVEVSAHAQDAPTQKEPVREEPSAGAASKTSGSLYVTAVALVVLTVGSLALLLLMMLLPRNSATSRRCPKSNLSIGDCLKRQDDRLTALDARIKEQLEKYEEA